MSIAVWFRESDEFPNGVVTYDDHVAEVEWLTEHIKERERVWSERERVAIKEAKRLEAEVENEQERRKLAERQLSKAVQDLKDTLTEVEHLTVERDEARAVAHHHAARRFVAERQVRRFLNLQRKHFGDGVATHLELKSLANQVRAALEAEDDE